MVANMVLAGDTVINVGGNVEKATTRLIPPREPVKVLGEAVNFERFHDPGGRFIMKRKRLFIWGAIAVALVVTISAAAMTATEAIKARQEAMEANGNAMKTLGAMAKNAQPFDADAVKAAAETIANDLAKAAELFPEGSDAGDVQTWAKPEIWTDREHFDQVLESTRQAAVDMQSVTESEGLLPALGKVGNGCKTCHDTYRLPKH
jgi:cytochrome c556